MNPKNDVEAQKNCIIYVKKREKANHVPYFLLHLQRSLKVHEEAMALLSPFFGYYFYFYFENQSGRGLLD